MEPVRLIEIKEDIMADNEALAEHLRSQMSQLKTLLVNLMSSPGSGKTSLVLRTIEALKADYKIGVVEADIDAMVDAELVAGAGVPAVQPKRGGICHLGSDKAR